MYLRCMYLLWVLPSPQTNLLVGSRNWRIPSIGNCECRWDFVIGVCMFLGLPTKVHIPLFVKWLCRETHFEVHMWLEWQFCVLVHVSTILEREREKESIWCSCECGVLHLDHSHKLMFELETSLLIMVTRQVLQPLITGVPTYIRCHA